MVMWDCWHHCRAINHISIFEAAERSNKRLRFLLRRCSCPGVLADQGMGGWSCNQFCLRGLCATLCRAWLAMVSSVCSRPPARSHATLCDQTSSSYFQTFQLVFCAFNGFRAFLVRFLHPSNVKTFKSDIYSIVKYLRNNWRMNVVVEYLTLI